MYLPMNLTGTWRETKVEGQHARDIGGQVLPAWSEARPTLSAGSA
jgi:hypothetical protein